MSKPRAVVTGGGRGIGRQCAVRLAADGYHVTVLDADAERAEQTAARVDGEAVCCDVTDEAGLASVAAGLPELDVLVNNAGIWEFTTLAETTAAQFHRVMSVNVLGALLGIQAFAPVMARSGGGAIVNLTSVVGAAVRPGFGIYPASKAAIVALTRQTALEYAAVGIRANAVGPGLVRTEGTHGTFGADQQQEAALGALLPLGRLGEPDEIADVVSFLTSAAARYVTGQVIYVDGGLTQATFPFLGRARGSVVAQQSNQTAMEET
jgi:NAD(P)-dependent dehydrogenase (short-subunit alcohol dehydrogenase family)